jgi:copper chaperone
VINLRYAVPGISCEHCVNVITAEVGALSGVTGVAVSLEHKTVTVAGEAASAAVVAAIVEAGYDVDGPPKVVDSDVVA